MAIFKRKNKAASQDPNQDDSDAGSAKGLKRFAQRKPASESGDKPLLTGSPNH